MTDPLLDAPVACKLCALSMPVSLVGYHMAQVHGLDPASMEFSETVEAVPEDWEEMP